MGTKRLVRSTSDKWLGGVLSGISDYFGWDPTVVRLLYLLVTICTAFSGVLAYIILWIVMPKQDVLDDLMNNNHSNNG